MGVRIGVTVILAAVFSTRTGAGNAFRGAQFAISGFPPLIRADAQPARNAWNRIPPFWLQIVSIIRENAMSPSVTKLAPVAVILVGALGLGGCATKAYVREQIAPVSQRVDSLEARLTETDATAKSALAQAQAASGQAQNNGQRLDQLNARVDGIQQQMEESKRKRPRN